MIIVQALLYLAMALAAICVPMALVIYAPNWLGWGFRNHPKATTAALIIFILAVLTAALTFGHLFPGCRVSLNLFGRALFDCS